ncbi:DUF1641 domain-containing protein [Pseudalkalibacillus sp. A8]|uniref:DUF1641 domain-containing protein n=1 Tax=Pseudalkalibacillus sp. A8 TaxID=3382641 RepID=UPI0038B62BA1
MAKAIKQIEKNNSNTVEESTQALNSLMEMTAKNREALGSLLEILQELHQSEILDMIKGFLKTRDQIGVLAIGELNQPGMHRIIKNGINAVEFLAELDPEQLKIMLNGINEGLKKSAENMDKKENVSLLRLTKLMRDPDVQRSLTFMMNFMVGMGQAIEKKTLH